MAGETQTANDVEASTVHVPRRISSIPRRRTSFVGREDDILAVETRLHGAPAVTLVGVGGVGKTRLAYEVASLIERRDDVQVHVVVLTSTTNPTAVPRVVADALGLPVTEELEPSEAIVARLEAAGDTLVVLDNCEQVVEGVAVLVDQLLDRCPDLRVLATSRVRLGVEGEHVWPVEPFVVDEHVDGDSPAIRLLVERAEASQPRALAGADHSRLTDLARRLDGVPLALELAAARLGSMSLVDLLDQLDHDLLRLESSTRGSDDRHRSLAGIVEWSYRLLSPEDQQLAARLSVFRGTFTRAAAAGVLDDADPDLLDRLVDTSLLSVTERQAGTRFLMLEMIREFLCDRLEESGAADPARRAHAEWTAALVKDLTVELRGPEEADAMARLVAELPNVGAALDWATEQGDAELVVDIVRGLEDHVLAGGGREVNAWLDHAVDQVWNDPDAIDVHLVASSGAMVRGDLARYRQILEQADALGVDGDEIAVKRPLEWASMLNFEGRVDEAADAALLFADDLPADPWEAATVLVRVVLSAAYAGRTDRGLELARQAIDLAELTESPSKLAWARYAEGEALMGLDPVRAIDSYHEAIRLTTIANNPFLAGMLSVALASALGRHGQPVESLEQFRETIVRWRDAGAWAFLTTALRNLTELLVRVDRFEEAVLVRCSVEWLDVSSNAGGVDADRDRYLKRLFVERLSATRYDELRDASHELTGEAIVELALKTIDDELGARKRTSEFRVIVFTDLERSTQYLAGAGDEEGRAAMRQYDVRTDDRLARHHGVRVKGTGDGVLATFPTVTDALDCMIELLGEIDRAVERGELPMRLRVGIHAGETIADMGDVHGTVVNLTARVVDRADGGEILVTDTVRQIAVGSDHEFSNLGEADLKGIPEPIRLHRLES